MLQEEPVAINFDDITWKPAWILLSRLKKMIRFWADICPKTKLR